MYDLRIKLAVMAFALISALLGQFLDKIFHLCLLENRYYVGFFINVFCRIFLQLLFSLGEENLVWKSLPHEETGISIAHKVKMEHGSDTYEITFEYLRGQDKTKKQSITEKWPIGNYFDKEGNVYVYGIETSVINMHKVMLKKNNKFGLRLMNCIDTFNIVGIIFVC